MRWTMPGLKFPLAGAALLALFALPCGAAARPAGRAGNYDARVMAPRALAGLLSEDAAVPLKNAPNRAELAGQVRTMRQALERLRVQAPGATARFSGAHRRTGNRVR